MSHFQSTHIWFAPGRGLEDVRHDVQQAAIARELFYLEGERQGCVTLHADGTGRAFAQALSRLDSVAAAVQFDSRGGAHALELFVDGISLDRYSTADRAGVALDTWRALARAEGLGPAFAAGDVEAIGAALGLSPAQLWRSPEVPPHARDGWRGLIGRAPGEERLVEASRPPALAWFDAPPEARLIGRASASLRWSARLCNTGGGGDVMSITASGVACRRGLRPTSWRVRAGRGGEFELVGLWSAQREAEIWLELSPGLAQAPPPAAAFGAEKGEARARWASRLVELEIGFDAPRALDGELELTFTARARDGAPGAPLRHRVEVLVGR